MTRYHSLRCCSIKVHLAQDCLKLFTQIDKETCYTNIYYLIFKNIYFWFTSDFVIDLSGNKEYDSVHGDHEIVDE